MLDLRMLNVFHLLRKYNGMQKVIIVGSIIIIIVMGIVVFKGHIDTFTFDTLKNMLALGQEVLVEPMNMIEPSLIENIIEPIVIK